MSAQEIANTFEALVGFVPEAIERLPPDSRSHGFDRVADDQTMSPAHLEAFTAIADEVATALVDGKLLAELVDGCPPEAIPNLAVTTTVTVAGNAMSLGPEWAVTESEDPQHGTTLYAPDPTASYSHAFEATGAYALRATVEIGGTANVAIVVDGEVVAAAAGVSGSHTLEGTASIDSGGSHVVAVDVQTEPDDTALEVVFEALTVEGPLYSAPGPDDAEVAACATATIDQLAPLAHRHPIDGADRARLAEVYDGLVASQGSARALHALLQAIFSSPRLLYLIELGQPVDDEPSLIRLDDWEIAARLSYALCEQPPDEPLRQAATVGQLRSPEQRLVQARRLMGMPCAKVTVERFVEQWLGLADLPNLNKSPETFPLFTDEVRQGLVSETKRFIEETIWGDEAPLASLFDATHAYPEASTAALWGLPSANGERIELGPERVGLLTSPAVMAVTAPFDGTSPVTRGVYVLEHILCDGTPPPPVDVDIIPPLPDPNATTRERWASHSSEPACASCHQLIDPIGFSFENFDGIGIHRTNENGLPIDASGGIPSLDVPDGSLDGGAAAAQAIASSDALRGCAATQWLRSALGRLETDADAATIDELAAAFDARSMREAMLALVASDTFVHRRRVATPPEATEEEAP